jgi:hypothetical protein
MQIKFFKKEKNFRRKNFQINLSLCWELAVGFAFLMIILSSIFGYQLFTKINQEFVLPAINENGKVPTVKKDRLEKALDYFSIREQKSTEIINSPAPIVDPSL